MTIYRQTVTLTIFSNDPLNLDVLSDNLHGTICHHNAVVDIDIDHIRELTDSDGKSQLHFRGFDPDVLDGYGQTTGDEHRETILTVF